MGMRALQSSERKSRLSVYESFDVQAAPQRGWLSRNLPIAFAGSLLVLAFVFASSMIGRNAVASNNPEEFAAATMVAPTTALEGKGSLLPADLNVTAVNVLALRRQTVITEDKADLVDVAPALTRAAPPPIPRAKPANFASLAAAQKSVKIIPASYNTSDDEEDTPSPAVKRMIATPAVSTGPLVLVPPVAQPIPQPSIKAASVPAAVSHIAQPSASPVLVEQRVRTAELTCLARAVYFEARSEPELGQLAVAKVILNRVKDPQFPKTICGVVYQGSEHRNSCQFSFACDGLHGIIRSPSSWATAKRIAERAISDDPAIRMLHAVNYHADYVNPRWSKTMRRLIRIGHHIFYSRKSEG